MRQCPSCGRPGGLHAPSCALNRCVLCGAAAIGAGIRKCDACIREGTPMTGDVVDVDSLLDAIAAAEVLTQAMEEAGE